MKRNSTLINLNLSVFFMMLGVGMIMALLPSRVIEITGSGRSVGLLASSFAVSYILLQVPIGNLSDKLGFKFFLFFGYLVCSAAGLLYYFSESANLIFLGRLIQGAGEAPIWALAPALLSIKFPASKGKVMGIYNAVIHVGLTIGPILGILVLKRWPGNQAFLFYAVVCLIGALIILLGVENAEPGRGAARERMNLGRIAALAANKSTLAALIGITLYGVGYGIFLTIIPAFLISVKGFSQAYISLFFSLFYVAISLSQVITGHFSDKSGREIFMITGLIIASLGIAVFPGLEQPFVTIMLTVASLGLGIFYISSMAYLNDKAPNSLKGTISGAYYLFWGIGFFAGPVIISRLGELPGFNTGFYIFSAALALEVILITYLYNKERRTGSQINNTGTGDGR
jgi:MFS family permease